MTTTTATARAYSLWPTWLSLASVATTMMAARFVDEGSGRTGALLVAGLLAIVAIGLAFRHRQAGSAPWLQRFVPAAALIAVAAALTAIVDGCDWQGATAGVLTIAAVIAAVVGVTVVIALALLSFDVRGNGSIEPARLQSAPAAAVTVSLAAIGIAAWVYGIQRNDARFDLVNKPASLSAATQAAVRGIDCAVDDNPGNLDVFLFFERGSPALIEVKDYFDALAATTAAKVQVMDAAIDPVLGKALKINKNGTIGFRCGARTESYTVGTERDEAQRKMAKLDDEVRTRLAKVGKAAAFIYLTTGHGERSFDEADKSGRASIKELRKLLESQNAKVKKLGMQEGLAQRVPADASMVVIAGPTQPFLPEEVRNLVSYAEQGGSVFIAVDPTVSGGHNVVADLEPLLARAGVNLTAAEVINEKEHVQESNTAADNAFIFAISFGNHKSVSLLSASRGKAALLLKGTGSVEKRKVVDDNTKVSLLYRSRPASYVDLNGNRSLDEPAEKPSIVEMAAATEIVGGVKEGRVVVTADSDLFADGMLRYDANTAFALETARWLLRDDAALGEAPTADADPPIKHTRDQDKSLFYGSVLLPPVVILAVGAVVLTLRKRRRRS